MAFRLALSRAASCRSAAVAACSSAVRATSVRAFATKPEVDDFTGLAGDARKEAVVEAAFGQGLYGSKDALAFFEEGTRENPIPVLSTSDSRIVGISLPDDSEVRWFNLKKGELVYDPDTCNYFALKQVSQKEVDEWVAAAEAKIAGSK